MLNAGVLDLCAVAVCLFVGGLVVCVLLAFVSKQPSEDDPENLSPW